MSKHQLPIGDFVFDVQRDGAADAPLVLLLHGFPQTAHTWRAELPLLARAGYFAVAPDQRGYSPGARPKSVDDYATQHLVSDVLRFADVLGAERFHLVGHDWGGQLAWLVAAHHPDRLHSLCVLSRPHPAAFALAMRSDPKQSKRSSHHRAFQSEDAADGLLADGASRLRAALSDQGVADSDVTAYLARLQDRAALDSAIHWYRAAPHSDESLLGQHVPAVRVRTMYLWGDADATVGRSAAEGTREFVDAPFEFRVVEGAGHFLTDQAPERVAPVVVEHVRDSR